MIRSLGVMLCLIWLVALYPSARAEQTEAPSQTAELAPSGPRVVCVGDAPAPGILRFAFQAEPAQRFRPELLRTGSPPARRRPAPAARPQRPVPEAPGAQVVYLPCING